MLLQFLILLVLTVSSQIIQHPVVGICFVLDDAIFWTWTFEFADMQAVMSWL